MELFESFMSILRSTEPSPLSKAIDFAREIAISQGMMLCPLQDPFRFRARFLALEIAEHLFDEEGHLQLNTAQSLLRDLQAKKYFIGPSLENDAFLFEHLQVSLQFLVSSDAVRKLLQKFALPLCHKGAERLVRDSLWPRQLKQVSISDVKKAVLAAWFTWLRQTTGSCFATAPAVLIQGEQPFQLLQDLFDLLTFGSLRRIVSGREYAVPICPSLEEFDLLRPLAGISAQAFSLSPGLKAALGVCGLHPSRAELMQWIEKEGETSTPKKLIEAILLRRHELDASDIKEQEELNRLEMNPLFAKQSAVYYQKPSLRSKKVSQWKDDVRKACTAYQALGDCALLRAWEATVASFSDVKVDIAKWNLYVSLGLHPDYTGGIGAFLYNRINQKLQILNRDLTMQQGEYERLMQIARNAERMGHSGEYNSALYQANSVAQQIEALSQEAHGLSELFPYLIQGYDRLIPDSFQEIFDPSLAQNIAEMIDDSPAGFRLAFKHGRRSSSVWTYIRTSDEFVRILREFFSSAEQELSFERPQDKKWIEELSTEVIQFIQTDEFLQTSIDRVQMNPAIRDKRAKPWEYISGGTMSTLLMTYYNRTYPFASIQRSIQNTQELLAFLIDIAHASDHAPKLLMQSPTHAFLLRLDWMPRDSLHAIEQMKQFWSRVKLYDEEWLAEKLAQRLPEREQSLFLHRWRQAGLREKLPAFRQALLESLPEDRGEFVDAFLYETLPLIERQKAASLAAELLGEKIGAIEPFFQDAPWITPVHFRERVKLIFAIRGKSPFYSVDIDGKIATALRERGLVAPKPILFADTNWSAGFFGLAISASGGFDLWRFHRTGMTGVPMRKWFQLQCEGEWIVFHKAREYSAP